ncbi:MAG TPA: group III truncated hemoglobin [Spongiibacteraceae bacterium]|nr:group III truncated hemoglobin [Spongiibacteraceae bacterium]
MHPTSKTDIETPADIDRLVEIFYKKYVLSDPIIGFFFTDIAHINLEKHLPKISEFWQLQLLGKFGYNGNTFAVHKDLHDKAQLTEDHFHRWLYLFEETIDELFEGPRANTAKQRAHTIARSMQRALANKPISPERMEELRGVQQIAPHRSDR